MTQYILYAWGFYYFIRKVDYKQFKKTWVNCLKGSGLILCGKVIAFFLNFLNRYDISSDKVDMLLGIPLIIFSVIKIAKLLNKREKIKEKKV